MGSEGDTAATAEVSVRRVRPDDGQAFRAIRVAALRDAPWAFAATLDATLARDDEWWAERVARAARGDREILLLAEAAGRPVGVVGGHIADDGVPELISMWVEPDRRGSGVARRLVEEVLAWARRGGHRTIDLWVLVGNEPARRLYERCGFVATGETGPLASDPSLTDERMICTL